MKPEDLLAMHLMEWPAGAEYLEQGLSGALYSQGCSPVGFIKELSSDFERVTYMQYLAARDRLHAAKVKDMQQPKNNPDEWLEIAKDQFRILTKDKDCRDLSHEQRAEFAFDAADAFINEMEKRK